MAESKATVLSQFRSAARALLLTHGLVESELHTEMRQLVLQASEGRPTMPVLYNIFHGGYSPAQNFSLAFKQFKQLGSSQTSSLAALCAAARVRNEYERHRVTDALLMAPFGQHVALEWPQVGDMVKVYVKHHLGPAFGRLRYITEHLTPKMHRFEQNIVALAGVVGRGSISDWAPFTHQLQRVAAPGLEVVLQQQQLEEQPWSSSALEEMVAFVRGALLQARKEEAEYRRTLVASFGAANVENMLASLQHSFLEEAAEAKVPAYERTQWFQDGTGHRLSLLEGLALYGEGNFRAWHCQSVFAIGAMRHLLRCPDHVRYLLATDPVSIPRRQYEAGLFPEATAEWPKKWDVELGLAAATSGTSSCFAIAQVPQLAEWAIDVYDGQESVAF